MQYLYYISMEALTTPRGRLVVLRYGGDMPRRHVVKTPSQAVSRMATVVALGISSHSASLRFALPRASQRFTVL